MIEFDEQDNDVFDKIMRELERHPAFDRLKVNNKSVLSLPDLDIYSGRRRVVCGGKDIKLTVKEYELLKLLAIHYHVNNFKKKIVSALPEAKFEIRCLREVGYDGTGCFFLSELAKFHFKIL